METTLNALKETLLELAHPREDDINVARARLGDLAHCASDAGLQQIEQVAKTLGRLLSLVETAHLDPDLECNEILEFVADGIEQILFSMQSDSPDLDEISTVTTAALERWCNKLTCNSEIESTADDDETNLVDDESIESDAQIGLILESLSPSTSLSNNHDETETLEHSIRSKPHPPELQSVVLDADTHSAFSDDGFRCLSSIENAVLAWENEQSAAPLEQICRDLHTLKGAAASIQLPELATYLHELEDYVTLESRSHQEAFDVEDVLQCVDFLRRQVAALKTSDAVENDTGPVRTLDSDTELSPDSIRVQAVQIDRLLDMLAELVMLRNRRDSQVEKLKEVDFEVQSCASRIRFFEETLERRILQSSISQSTSKSEPITSLAEISNDLVELGRNLRNTFEPLVEENLVLSRFISQFRSEMMELQRVPVGSLFKRLQRIVRDAGKAENKRIKLNATGGSHGLEKSLLDKLFEPLMHIVRNAVSHGIESPDARCTAGKSEVGQLSIEARKGSNLFVIEVRDDGRGLDYDALRRRGIERGLLASDRPISHDELSNLIFTAGFSTREDVNEISGRGVGMDVVAATIEAMHGWIELESIPGQGTCVRVLVPRCSFIEHAMVFRVEHQKFAISAQYVKANRRSAESRPQPVMAPHREIDLRQCFFSSDVKPTRETSILVIQTPDPNNANEIQELELIVDAVEGPEEVVVRPLPGLLKSQSLFSGVTLSGCGALMLLIDPHQILVEETNDRLSHPTTPSRNQRILVVDDSPSSRHSMVRKLSKYPFIEIDQASDGAEAFQLISNKSYDAIFTDIDMPKMSGFELLTEMRSSSSIQQIPVTVVSGRTDDSSKSKAESLGASSFIVKPADEQTIKTALEQMMLL